MEIIPVLKLGSCPLMVEVFVLISRGPGSLSPWSRLCGLAAKAGGCWSGGGGAVREECGWGLAPEEAKGAAVGGCG